jgi:hypothetical protein
MKTCACKTKTGARCSRSVKNSKYCWQHSKAPGPQNLKKSPRKLTGDEEEIQRKYCNCVMKIKAKSPKYNAFAVCTKSVGRVTNSCKAYE